MLKFITPEKVKIVVENSNVKYYPKVTVLNFHSIFIPHSSEILLFVFKIVLMCVNYLNILPPFKFLAGVFKIKDSKLMNVISELPSLQCRAVHGAIMDNMKKNSLMGTQINVVV